MTIWLAGPTRGKRTASAPREDPKRYGRDCR